jgi:penicillin amidase
MKKIIWAIAILLIAGILGVLYFINSNEYQKDGQVALSSVESNCHVFRDENNMPYIYTESILDALKVQGFVTAQDRLFQMTLTKLMASGRLSELLGEKGLASDKKFRTLGLLQLAKKHAQLLDADEYAQYEAFTKGVNEFIDRNKNIPIEFKMAGLPTEKWEVAHSLAIAYLMAWDSAANIKSELISQAIIDKIGIEKYNQISPLQLDIAVLNIMDTISVNKEKSPVLSEISLNHNELNTWLAGEFSNEWGSNGWAVNGNKSNTAKPIVASDPHLNPTSLPGVFYPCGLFFEDMRIVGVTVPGIPGIIIGRNQHVALGLTNAYGDGQDLNIETIDPNNPNNYLEGEVSIPFKTREEILKIKDKTAENGYREEKLIVRSTNRGPIILDPLVSKDKTLSIRWISAEVMKSKVGINGLLTATSVNDIKASLEYATISHHNATFADVNNNLGWQTTGRLPIRKNGKGNIPFLVTSSEDNWIGVVPYSEQPQNYAPSKNWIGNANNYTVSPDYPYHYTNSTGARYRYLRLKELLDNDQITTAEDHWKFQRDDMNILARKFAPLFIKYLENHPKSDFIIKELQDWNFEEKSNSTASLLFNSIYRNLAKLTYQDELGEDLTNQMFSYWYYWQERLETLIISGDSEWFDDINTTEKEDLQNMIHQATTITMNELEEQLGNNPTDWKWGMLHKASFTNPIRRTGFGKSLLGAKSYSMNGSGETLHRARYNFNKPFEVDFMASLRMVADLNDDEKVMAIMAGGVTGRTFSKYMSNQLDDYFNGTIRYWWFSDKSIKSHSQSKLEIVPLSR